MLTYMINRQALIVRLESVCNLLSEKEGLGSLVSESLLAASPEAGKEEELADMDLSTSLL